MITQFTDVLESNNFLSKDTNTFISEDDIYCNWYKSQNYFRLHVTPNTEAFSDITRKYSNFKEFCKYINTPSEVMDWYARAGVQWPSMEDGDPNDRPFSYPDDIIKTHIGNCWDHALFMYCFCKVKGIPAAVLSIACYCVNRRVNEWWRFGHKICAFKDTNGWYLFNYFPEGWGSLFGPYKTKEDAAKGYAKYYERMSRMMAYKNNPLLVREFTKPYYRYNNIEEDYLYKHMNDKSFSQNDTWYKFFKDTRLSKYDDMLDKQYKSKDLFDWMDNIKELAKAKLYDWLIKESYVSLNTFPIECIHPQETEYTCGPACARTLVHYYTGYVDETEQDVATIMGTNINTGTTMDGMVRYFKDHLGWKVNNSMMEGSPSAYDDFKLFLDYNLSHGMCIIVENKAFGGHWRIIVGFNEDTDTLTMVDPYNKVGTGITMVNARDFFTTWYDTNLGSYKAWVTAKPNE